jgi:hypothetical protein
MNKVTKWFLLFMALPTLLVGLTALFDPNAIMGQVDVFLDNNSAKSSTRAIYGGMHIAFGLFFLYGAFKDQKTALWILFLYGTGFVAGRLLSLGLDGMPNPFISTWIFVESFTALFTGWLLFQKISQPKPALSGI